MEIKSKNGDTMVIALSGRLDLHSAEPTEKAILNELEGIMNLELDLTTLEYVSSAGLRTMLSVKKNLNAKGGSMVLSGVNSEVMDILEVTGFTDILDIK